MGWALFAYHFCPKYLDRIAMSGITSMYISNKLNGLVQILRQRMQIFNNVKIFRAVMVGYKFCIIIINT